MPPSHRPALLDCLLVHSSNHCTNNKEVIQQAGWFLRPDCAPRSKCPQFRMPIECRAQFRVPNVPRSQISECSPFRSYEHAQCRVFECTSLQRAYVIPCQQQMGLSAVLWARRSALVFAAWTGVSRPYLRYGDRGRLQNVSSPSFLFVSSQFFYNTQETQMQKNDGPEFWKSNSVIFENFFKFSKMRRAVPLWPSGPLWSRPN